MSRLTRLCGLVLGVTLGACGDAGTGDARDGGGDGGERDGGRGDAAVSPQLPGTIEPLLGTGEAGAEPPTEAPVDGFRLNLPLDLAVGEDGTIYFLDWNNFMVRAIVGDRVVPIVGNGLLDDVVEGPALATGMSHTADLLLDGRGGLYVSGWHASRVIRVDLAAGLVGRVAGTGTRAYAGDDGPATAAAFDLPAGLAWASDGRLLVTDQANQVVRGIDVATGVVAHVAGRCVAEPDGPCATPAVACPGTEKLACDVSQCGYPCSPAFAGDGADVEALRLGLPFGAQAMPSGKLAVAPDGTIVIVDTWNDRVRAIGPDGAVTTIAGGGTSTADGVPATDARLEQPSDVARAPDGTLYVAVPYDHCVRRVAPDGTITTVAGVCGTAGDDGDGGPATAALLDRPFGLALDAPRGRLYVADTMNHRIRVVRL